VARVVARRPRVVHLETARGYTSIDLCGELRMTYGATFVILSTMSTVTVHTCADHRGDWDVELPDRAARVTCHTIDEARSVALEYAAKASQPCEVIVRDAYNRVMLRELIDHGSRN